MSKRLHSEGSLPFSARKIATGTAGTPNMAAYAQVTNPAVRDRFIEVPPFPLLVICVVTRCAASVTQAEDAWAAESCPNGSGGERPARPTSSVQRGLGVNLAMGMRRPDFSAYFAARGARASTTLCQSSSRSVLSATRPSAT